MNAKSRNFKIRKSREDDLPAIKNVLALAFGVYGKSIDPPSSVLREDHESLVKKFQTGEFFVATCDSVIYGCIYRKLEGQYTYLGRLAVHPNYQNQGVGSRLLQHMQNIPPLGASKKLKVHVRVSLDANIGFFEKHGFEFFEYGTHAGYLAPTFKKLAFLVQDSSTVTTSE